MNPTKKEEEFIEMLLSKYSWDEGKRVYYQKVAVIVLDAIRQAKKEIFDELDDKRNTNIMDENAICISLTLKEYNEMEKHHLSTLQEAKEHNIQQTQSAEKCKRDPSECDYELNFGCLKYGGHCKGYD